jgi:DNA-directed RNA polymerase specialized sigma24 family protein
MSVRTAAATVTAPLPKAGPRHGVYLHHGGPVTVAEREAAADGAAAGWKARQREAALDVIGTADHVPGASYCMPPEFWPYDRETGERVPEDARAVLAAAEAAAAERVAARPEARVILARMRTIAAERPLTAAEAKAKAKALDIVTARASVGRYRLADPMRMATADVIRLAAYARRCAERMARPRLTEAEGEDVNGQALAAILAKAPHPGGLPRWDALAGAERTTEDDDALAASGITLDDRKGAWRGFSYLEARSYIRQRHARLSAEQAADFSAPGEDETPTPEQAAALAAEAASAVLADALDTGPVQHGTYALAATADDALSAPERDALSMALSGLTRSEIAAARAVSTEAVKKAAQRGRKALQARATTEDDARRWAACAGRRLRNLHRPDDRTPAERAMAADVARNRAVKLTWPDRVAPYADPNAEGDDAVPAPIIGAGTRANVPALSAGPGHAEGRQHAPRPGGPERPPLAPLPARNPHRPAPRQTWPALTGDKRKAQAAQAARAQAEAQAAAEGIGPIGRTRIGAAAAKAAAARVPA